jgi:hypothetical protein
MGISLNSIEKMPRRLSENTFMSFRTEHSEERNLVNSWCYNEQDFSLPLEMTVLGHLLEVRRSLHIGSFLTLEILSGFIGEGIGDCLLRKASSFRFRFPG